MYIHVGLSVNKKAFYLDSSVNAEVIVALQCGLTACVQFSAPSKYKGIQPSQTWHTRPQQDGPPHESI